MSAHADGAVYVHTLDGSLVASTIVALRNVTAVPVVDVLGTGRPTIVVVSRLPDSTDRRNSGGRAPPAAPLPPATTTTSLAPVVATTPPSSRAVALWLNASLELEITGPPLALDDMDGSVWASATTAAVYSDGFQGGVQQQQRQHLPAMRLLKVQPTLTPPPPHQQRVMLVLLPAPKRRNPPQVPPAVQQQCLTPRLQMVMMATILMSRRMRRRRKEQWRTCEAK